MIFSADKWETEGVTKIVHASHALSFDTMRAPLTQAWEMFFFPILGAYGTDLLTTIFNKNSRTDKEQHLLNVAQMALANLALWYNFTELNVRLTDQGHQRQESENFKSLFKYQEDEMRNSYRNKGFNALDNLIQLLDSMTDDYPEWKEETTYISRQKSIVKGTAEINSVVFINGSNIIALRFMPLIDAIDQTSLRAILGTRLYEAFHKALADGAERIGETTVEELRCRIARVVVNLAAEQLIRESGTITDRGLYFVSLTAGKEGNKEASIPGNSTLASKAAVYRQKAEAQISQLNNFVEYYIPDLFAGRISDTFKRDNNGKRSVWL